MYQANQPEIEIPLDFTRFAVAVHAVHLEDRADVRFERERRLFGRQCGRDTCKKSDEKNAGFHQDAQLAFRVGGKGRSRCERPAGT